MDDVKWKLDRRLSLSLLVVLALQISATVWWGASLQFQTEQNMADIARHEILLAKERETQNSINNTLSAVLAKLETLITQGGKRDARIDALWLRGL